MSTMTMPEVTESPAERLETTCAAVRLSFTWFGCSKSLTPSQRAVVAGAFGATERVLSAGKKLLDTRHPAYAALTGIRRQAVAAWRGMTLPFTEPGIRLIRRSQIALLDGRLKELRGELAEAARQLDAHYEELLRSARERLGTLFEASDYPPRLSDWFSMDWDYPSIQPPDYLRQLSPELYEQECRRVRARFEEAVQLAERAFMDEFARMVKKLCRQISGDQGRQRCYSAKVVGWNSSLFESFRDLHISSQPELDALVDRAQAVLAGIQPDEWDRCPDIRRQMAEELEQVSQSLEALMVDRPRRRLIRSHSVEEGT